MTAGIAVSRATAALAATALSLAPATATPFVVPGVPVDAIVALATRPAACAGGDGITLAAGHVVAARLFERMQGFASEAGTTGGLGQHYLEVSRGDDAAGAAGMAGTLRWAVERARRDGGGWIGFAMQLRGGEIALQAPLRIAANVTIDGGCAAPLITAPPDGSILYVQRTQNVVLTRLRLTHRGPSIDGKLGGDCITVSHGTDQVWIAYNDIGHCTDGQVDVTQSGIDAPMRATVAHNYFHDHDKAMLISGDHCRDTATPCDAVALTPRAPGTGVEVTLQADVFVATGQRHPRVSGQAFADVSASVVAYRPQRRADGQDGGNYGAFASNGGHLLIRNSLYVALDPARASRAVVVPQTASPGAVRTDGLVVRPAASPAAAAAPTLVAVPRYSLDREPVFAADPGAAALCVAAAAGIGGWDRAAPPRCRG